MIITAHQVVINLATGMPIRGMPIRGGATARPAVVHEPVTGGPFKHGALFGML